MTPEELDEARAEEAVRRFGEPDDKYELAYERELAAIAARLAREGWTPPEPEPEPVDPDVLAFREWLVEQWPDLQEEAASGETDSIIPARAYFAGARMAREQERERAKVLVEYVEVDAQSPGYVGHCAGFALAKYRGEA